ncbi:MAG: hypothetical protein ACRAUW_16060 [Aeromonas sp.]
MQENALINPFLLVKGASRMHNTPPIKNRCSLRHRFLSFEEQGKPTTRGRKRSGSDTRDCQQSPDVERKNMGRFNAFLPANTGLRLPGAFDLQACESIVSLRSLQARAAALIEEKA